MASTQRSMVPFFDVATTDGRRVRYADLWQQRPLVLAALHGLPETDARRYASHLTARARDLEQHDSALVITRDALPELEAPAVVLVDRWGEIARIFPGAGERPDVAELLEWLTWLHARCPECEGEAR